VRKKEEGAKGRNRDEKPERIVLTDLLHSTSIISHKPTRKDIFLNPKQGQKIRERLKTEAEEAKEWKSGRQSKGKKGSSISGRSIATLFAYLTSSVKRHKRGKVRHAGVGKRGSDRSSCQ